MRSAEHPLASWLVFGAALCAGCTPISPPASSSDETVGPAPADTPAALFDYDAAASRLAIGDAVPEVAMHDRHGGTLSLSAFRGKTVVLTFVAGRDNNDNDAEMLRRLAEVGRAAGPRLAEKMQLLTLALEASPLPAATLGSLEETPARAGVNVPWTFVAARPRDAGRLAAAFGVVVWQYADGTVGHSFNTVVIDPEGYFVDQFPGLAAWSPRDVVAAASVAAGR